MSDLEEVIRVALRTERARAGLTQDELGERLGLSARVVHSMERGPRPVTLAEAPAICRALGLTLAQFLAGADPDDLDALGV